MNVGILSALAGAGSSPETGASPRDTAVGEASFVAALLQAFGLDNKASSEPVSDEQVADVDARLAALIEAFGPDRAPLGADSAAGEDVPESETRGPLVRTVLGAHGSIDGARAPAGAVDLWHELDGSFHESGLGRSGTHPAEPSHRAMGSEQPMGLALGRIRNDATLGAPAMGGERPAVATAKARSVDRATVPDQNELEPRPTEGATESEVFDPRIATRAPESSGASEVPLDVRDGVGRIDLASEPANPVVQEQERSADVDRADSSLNRVAPALREKVERVIERMRDEFGHEVTVVEGYRSPDRQAHIYRQGRGQPGEIVTWTERSWHTEGLAADLEVDGSFNDRLAYARLQRIAREEGLRTLGSRDLGHVELPNSRMPGSPRTTTSVLTRATFAGVAAPAPVASPAAPAGIARVAAVATPGSSAVNSPARADAGHVPPAPAAFEAPVLAMNADGESGDGFGSPKGRARAIVDEVGLRSDRRIPSAGAESRPANASGPGDDVVIDGSRRPERVRGDDLSAPSAPDRRAPSTQSAELPEITVAPKAGEAPEARAAPDPPTLGAGGAARPAGAVESVDGPTALDRVERIQELRDLAKGIRPSSVSLRLDGAGSDRLRVSLLNRAVAANLNIADPVGASLLRGRVSDLSRALESRGLGLSSLALNGVLEGRAASDGWLASPAEAATELLRTLVASGAGDTGRGGGDRERPAPQQRTNQDRPGSDRARRESEKEHERDR